MRGEPSFAEAAAKTLEYAYDDFCAAQLARALGRTAEAEAFARTAMNYTNLFDAKTGFMRGRKADGSWCEPFYPTEWGGPFTEGCSWHWTWSVMQDVPGLIKLMGGDKAFAAKLDAVFTSPNTFKAGTYGNPIHEMTEMAALDMGQYAHGNEPVHHMIYLYDYVGQPWKTQARIRLAMNQALPGHPRRPVRRRGHRPDVRLVCLQRAGLLPGLPGRHRPTAIGSPLFDRATVTLAGGKTFTVLAEHNGPQHPYIRGAKLNGQPFDKVYLTHDQLVNGGQIVFDMASAPDYKWATAPPSRPPATMPEKAP